ncbi:hypothetical protein UFOVP1229_85 [uncultured Caudovirales phage]|uniref:Uncharacterized protein n=1 Tax=uncultured Caudovirales phage TaxID=2100421 RepID=A0A6J5R437_9CAUD|nr:hypothetical protein UFOVP1229_85 [uncultured Caudovirales phage]
MSKAEAVSLAKRISRKPANVHAEENPKAMSKAQRDAAVAVRDKQKARRSEIAELLKAIPSNVRDGSELFTAAEFVVDVDADDPSLPQLKEAVARRREYLALKEEDRDLDKAIRSVSLWSRRYSVSEYDNTIGLPMNLVLADGDTWDEVCEKLRSKSK